MYYDTEQPLQSTDFNKLCRQLLANSDEEKEALRYVLSEFFTLTGDVYTHNYCDGQIEKYRTATSAKAKAGLASAESKKKKVLERVEQRTNKKEHAHNKSSTETNTRSTSVTNHKPLTNNHKPITTLKPTGVPSELWDDFLQIRKELKARNTERAIKSLVTELEKLQEAGHDMTQVIEQSIRSSWKDVYPIKAKDKANGHDSSKWWESDQETLAMQKSLGLSSIGGESWKDLRGRIRIEVERRTHG